MPTTAVPHFNPVDIFPIEDICAQRVSRHSDDVSIGIVVLEGADVIARVFVMDVRAKQSHIQRGAEVPNEA